MSTPYELYKLPISKSEMQYKFENKYNIIYSNSLK